MNAILDDNEVHHEKTINIVTGIIAAIKDKNFNFWLSFFHDIMPYVDILYGKLQKINIDQSQVRTCSENFERIILSKKGKIKVPESIENEGKIGRASCRERVCLYV